MNGALVGGAVGLALGFGVVYLGPVIAGSATASTSAATTAFATSTLTSFAAGASGYAIEEYMNDRTPTIGNTIGHGGCIIKSKIQTVPMRSITSWDETN